MAPATRVALVFSLFFLSGAAGLVYQVVWSRLLTLVIGVSIFAITTVICTFMGGLALGSWALGRAGHRLGDPLRAYGVLEALIGIYAVLTPWIFEAIQPAYVAAFRGLEGPALNAFRVLLSGGVLLIPTAMMGGTLPLLSRAVAGQGSRAAGGVGRLYAINTFGAVAGCLTAGFVLLAAIGVRGSLFVAAGMNLVIAAIAFLAPRGQAEEATTATAAGRWSPRQLFVLAIFFVTGFAALGYEVLWTRALLVYVHSSAYAFSVMLAVYLFGVALGSLAAAGPASRSRRPLLGLAGCQVGVVAGVVVGLACFPHLEDMAFTLLGSRQIGGFGDAVVLMLSQAGIVMLLPTVFMGAMFPYGVAAYHDGARGIGHSVGTLYAVNTAGNIAGSILVGFFAISLFGVRNSMIAMIGLNLAVLAAIALVLSRTAWIRLGIPAGSLAVLVLTHASVSQHLFYDSIARIPGQQIAFYREGASDTVAVVEVRKPRHARTLVYSDGRGAAGTGSLPFNLYFGHLPMLLHPDPQEILHICWGSGNSVLALTRHDPQRIDAVELSPHVREAANYFWTNEGVVDRPEVNLIIEDGRNFLLGTDRRYDVISLEPPNIYSAGVVNLYTQEFYELARSRLKPGGLMVQWLPTATLSEKDRGHLIRAFTEAFPHATAWQQLVSPVLLLMGSLEPLHVDLDAVQRRLESQALQRDLVSMKLRDAVDFLSFFRVGDESLRALVEEYAPVRDDHTIVDYSIPRFVGSGFGFYHYTYAVRSDEGTPDEVVKNRAWEYSQSPLWRDPASLIVPDPEQAARITERRNGRPAPAP